MDKAERRLELLRAARDVFATKGYHAAKVDDIVARASVAKGTFYLYFPDKRSVFVELVDGLFSRLGGAILTVDTQGDIEAQIKHNIRGIVAVLLDDPALTQLLLSFAPGLDPAFAAKIRSFYDGVKTLLRVSLDEGQRLGIVAEGDTSMYATFTVGALKEIFAESTDRGQAWPREQLVEQLFRLLQRGYLRIDRAPEAPVSVPPKPRKTRKKTA
ncbi:TetR/AcrR family transcriptional regulator [Polyangium jinanense]|uniref:TetR/AcrR family transcriptional regulator n=1 Tax=Polyangium jinanense TaxID=2829994 RepID=A0A9X4AS96_9BACT|nr:TetR/AcrR family transcriptional regulator [Polyangium jinanense]MDC3955639.1 TetR/AcrR family transcriptional regulator [Polyangium jinanense]MDC3982281.1 TetR/AcrR family transcriptional regulator [Polyangium jinanense]